MAKKLISIKNVTEKNKLRNKQSIKKIKISLNRKQYNDNK